MVFNYYYGSEADQFNFIRIPKRLITDPLFADLSLSAKLLYGILLDRMSLSMKNKWLDEINRVFIIYQISEIMENLNVAEKTAIKTLKELEVVGLVEKRRRGLGLPSLLYVKNFIVDENQQERELNVDDDNAKNEDNSVASKLYSSRAVDINSSRTVESTGLRTVESGGSRTVESEGLRPVESAGSRAVDNVGSITVNMNAQEQQKKMALISNTDLNNNDYNHIKSNQIIIGGEIGNDEISTVRAYEELISENIDYNILLERYPYERELIKGMYSLIVEVVLNKSNTIVISSSEFSTELVRNRFLKLNASHIEYVIHALQGNITKVNNIKKYLLASLFNAPSTISGYYQAEVNYDMPQFARK